MPKKSIQKFKYLENEKGFSHEIKNIFHHFWRAIIERNKKNFFWKLRVRLYMSKAISQYLLQTKLLSVYPSHHNRKNCIYHTYIYILLQIPKRKTFESLVFKNNLKFTGIQETFIDFLNFVLVCKEDFPKYGNGRNKVFFSNIVNWGRCNR